MKTLGKVCSLSIILIAGCSNFSSGNSIRQSSEANIDEIDSNDESCKASFNGKIIPVNLLIQEYTNNPILFDSEYKGKCLAVSGIIERMNTALGYDLTLIGYEPERIISCNSKYKRGSQQSCQQEGYQRWTRRMGSIDSCPQLIVSIPESGAQSLSDVKPGVTTASFLGRLSGILDDSAIKISEAHRIYEHPYQALWKRMEDIYTEKEVNDDNGVFYRSFDGVLVWKGGKETVGKNHF